MIFIPVFTVHVILSSNLNFSHCINLRANESVTSSSKHSELKLPIQSQNGQKGDMIQFK